MIKKIILMLLVLVGGVMTVNAAATLTKVYYAVPSDVVGNYTVKLNMKLGSADNEWRSVTMTKTDKTYFGNYVYSCEFTDLYGGLYIMQIQLYDGETWKSQKEPYNSSSWISVSDYNGKMYDHNVGWVSYNYDKNVTIHCLKKNNWDKVYVHNYFNNGNSDQAEFNFPGHEATQSTLSPNWYDYTITGRPCTSAIVSNGYSGEGNQSGTIAIGDEKEYWVTYDGSNTTCVSEVPADFNYSRTNLTSGNLGTICLPYAATVSGATVYKITGAKFDSNSKLEGIYVDPVNYLDAGKAYIIKVDAESTSITATLSGNPTTTAVDANGMLGNLSSSSVSVPTGNYIIKDNLIRKVAAGTITIGQYKAYITLNNIGETPSPYFIGADDTTGIEGLEIENSQNDIYNLQGQRVTNIQKGVYIVNGKKVLVK